MGDLSLGWRQKTALAAAFIDDPDLIVLDEPTSGLDPVAVENITSILLAGKAKGKTVLFSSHQLSEVERIADRVGIISEGRLIKTGSVNDLLEKSDASTLNELFLGSMEEAK